MQLADVGNAQAKKLIDAMRTDKRSDKTIVEYVCIMKSIVASAVDSEGEQLFPRQWNHDFMRLPIVEKTKQRRPKVTNKEVETIIAEAKPKHGLMYALMAILTEPRRTEAAEDVETTFLSAHQFVNG